MSTPEEVKEIAQYLSNKKNLRPMEKEFLAVYNNGTYNEERILELIKIGRGQYIKTDSDYKKQLKDSATQLQEYGKKWDSVTGKWTEQPPMPPQIPDDCVIL